MSSLLTKMKLRIALMLCGCVYVAHAQPGKCDQKPGGATAPASDGEGTPFHLSIKTSVPNLFTPDQTYVLVLESTDSKRPFKEFMITVEDPEVDNNINQFNHKNVDVGTLKTLEEDLKSKYSERCYSSVESKDISEKQRVEMHWVSPKKSKNHAQRVRFRAMVAENNEAWYTGGNLDVILKMDDSKPPDHRPVDQNPSCNLCSEARYEVIFTGQWSRGTHNLHYPSKPDDNKYSRMIGASHSTNFVLWEPGKKASKGLKTLAEQADISELEQQILDNMTRGYVRTLIRGKMHQHPHMSEPSQALFRVDKVHHMFSLVVAMKPSPDWFLGTYMFELCKEDSWLDSYKMPLYPWDAGTRDGASYDSPPSETAPVDNVARVAVGSFDKASPFYQTNLNDLKPFAILTVTKLNEYQMDETTCSTTVPEPKQ